MAKIQVKPKPGIVGLRQVAVLTLIVVLFNKAQRVTSEEMSTSAASQETAGTGSPTPICPDYCNLAPDTATRSKAPFPRWYYEPTEGACKRFRWGGRGGNKNRFFKRSQCEQTCSGCTSPNDGEGKDENQQVQGDGQENADRVCNLPMDEGHCRADLQSPKQPQLSWFFDSEGEKCSPFIFYGCGGNGNRFLSKADCEDICG